VKGLAPAARKRGSVSASHFRKMLPSLVASAKKTPSR
jgi:hypothetical protein